MSRIQIRGHHRFHVPSALAAVLVLCAFGALLAPQALGQEEADRDYWVKRYETLSTEVADLRARVDMLESQYSRSKRRNYPRGQQLEDLRIALDEARKELAAKEEEWENFPDEARRAGALPGWFRD